MQGDFEDRIHPELTPDERSFLTIGGSLLALYGLSRRSTLGLALAALGGSLVYRAQTGQSVSSKVLGSTARHRNAPPWRRPIRVEHSLTINRPREEIYAFWRNFENLPQFMDHLDEVRVIDEDRSYWVAKAPAHRQVAWEARIVTELPGEQISWESLPGSSIPNKGTVRFQDAPGERGTEVRVSLEYMPPAGVYGAALARLFREEPQIQVDEDMRRFKAIMEAGEAPTIAGQPSGRAKQQELANEQEIRPYMG